MCVCVCVCVCVCDHWFLWLGLFICMLIRYLLGGGCVGIFFCFCWFVLFFVNSLVGCLNMIGDLMF